jgi:hypothetical protein
MTSGVISQLNSGRYSAEEAGWYLSNGFAVGIGNGVGNVMAKASYVAYQAIEAAKREAGIQSPSKVMKEVGMFFDKGLELGIKGGEKDIVKAATNLSENLIGELDINKELDNMYKEMNETIRLENAKLNLDVVSGNVYNKSFYETPIKVDVKADVEMDNEKVGRLVTPSVMQTVRQGGYDV